MPRHTAVLPLSNHLPRPAQQIEELFHPMPTRKILIVHDETSVARDLGARLADLGYEVAAIASSGSEAIALAARVEPALVLMKLALHADMSGMEAADELQRPRPIPILFTITDGEEASLRRAGVTAPHRYLVTPFTDRELSAVIELTLCEQDAAREAREMEEQFFSISIDMFCFLDYNGYFKRLNPAWERTLGFTREELMSRPFIDFVHPDDRERTLKQNRQVRSGGQALAFENRYRCKDGSYRWLLWNAAPSAGEQVIYSVARDITARKRAEEERERLVGELQAALAEVTALRAILPICSYCRKIRDDENYWHTVESYFSTHTNTRFSHGICPSCMVTEVEPQFAEQEHG